MADQKDAIRDRAYRIWEEEGRPHGRDIDHWIAAEQEVGAKSRTLEKSRDLEKKSKDKPAATRESAKMGSRRERGPAKDAKSSAAAAVAAKSQAAKPAGSRARAPTAKIVAGKTKKSSADSAP